MKSYLVSADITMSKYFSISAENEEQAKAEAYRLIAERPNDYACNFSNYVCHEIYDVLEEEEEEEEV